MEFKAKYEYTIDGRKLYVFDSIFSRIEAEEMDRFLRLAPSFRGESDSKKTASVRQFATPLKHDLKMTSPFPNSIDLDYVRIYSKVDQAIAQFFPETALQRYRAYCNHIVYGDMTYRHRDCNHLKGDVTTLIYANRLWKQAWGGETIFYNDRGDAVAAVNPKPGRVLLFHGAIEHCVGLPQRECYESRLTFAIKYREVVEPAVQRRPKARAREISL